MTEHKIYSAIAEKGLGVKKDPVEAFNWYRKASGMSGNIALDTGELQALRTEVQERKRSEEALRRQLEQTLQQLDQAQRELRRRRGQAAAAERRWEEAKKSLEAQKQQASSHGDNEAVSRFETQIQARDADLERQRLETARLEGEAEHYRQQLVQLEGERKQLQTLKQEVGRQEGEGASLRQAWPMPPTAWRLSRSPNMRQSNTPAMISVTSSSCRWRRLADSQWLSGVVFSTDRLFATQTNR